MSWTAPPFPQVLKYKSVKEVVMVELDEEVVTQSRLHLPVMNNCSWESTTHGFDSCFDNKRTTMVYEDAAKWFRTQFGADACKSSTEARHSRIRNQNTM